MCSAASTILNKNNVIRFLVGFLHQCGNFEVVLCGSAINLDVNQVRDVDFMIYVSGNRNEFLKTNYLYNFFYPIQFFFIHF